MNYHEMNCTKKLNYRKSGLLLAGILASSYAALLVQGRHQPYILIAAAVVVCAVWVEAQFLRRIVDLLVRCGEMMQRYTSPVLFAMVYCFAVIPTAYALKLLGKDVLTLGYNGNRTTYFEARQPGNGWHDSFRNQF